MRDREPLPPISMSPESESFEREVLAGLSLPRKALPPKLLYDRRGSELFERICGCREYYVTRTETAILEAHAEEMARALGPHPVVIELGSGASRKTRILLRHLQAPAAYLPVDISKDFLIASSRSLAEDFPRLPILPVCADFTAPVRIPADAIPPDAGRKVAFFPGSTIGNFDRQEARAFLERTARLVEPGGQLLLGVDLIKDKAILEPAYDDSEGITAEFNLNLLERMRRELGATVDPRGFRHRAFFNESEGRVEMHLESLAEQEFEISGRCIRFRLGETIHTESSYKYEPARFEEMAGHAGFSVVHHWTDASKYFAVYLLEARSALEQSPHLAEEEVPGLARAA